jgi:hypothetical protein
VVGATYFNIIKRIGPHLGWLMAVFVAGLYSLYGPAKQPAAASLAVPVCPAPPTCICAQTCAPIVTQANSRGYDGPIFIESGEPRSRPTEPNRRHHGGAGCPR